jgi:peptidyl-prolyl cis-trans isomerase B (cyclophilin B)
MISRQSLRSGHFTLLLTLGSTFALGMLLLSGCIETPDRDDALKTLARWEDRRLADPDSLAAMIGDPDAHIRRAAVRSAGLIGRTDVLPAVLDAMDDSSDAVRTEACLALGFLGDESAAAPLAAAVGGEHTRVRHAALFALARIPNDGSALWDVALHGEARDAALAWNALRDHAADLDSTRLAETIQAGLVRSESDVLWRVLRCAERSGAKEIIPEVAGFTVHRSAAARAHACRALSRLGDGNTTALEAVLAALNDLDRMSQREADRVRIQALRAIGTLAGAQFQNQESEHIELVTALTEGARSDNPHVARTALESMAAAVTDLPLPKQAIERESLLPVWRIRLLQSARSHLVQLDESLSRDLKNSPETVVRAAAIGAVCALRGEGVMNEGTWDRIIRDQAPLAHLATTAASAEYVIPPDVFLSWSKTLVPMLKPRMLLTATEAMMSARERYADTDEPFPVRNSVDQRIEERLRAVIAGASWAPVAQATAQLGAFPSDENLGVLIQAWHRANGRVDDDVRLGVLDALGQFFPDHERSWTVADSLLTETRLVVSEGFDSPDIRQRLRSRTVATTSGLLAEDAIPTEGSLRATVPAVVRHPDQGTVALPFDAPKVRCTTDRGEFIITLDGNLAPNTCATFLALIRDQFFDGLTFHRVVPDFVVQGGDPDGTGWGSPGYSIRSEWSDAPFERGTVGIAHSGKDTGGCQFFVCHSDQPHLNGRYTVFGQVEKGMDIVDLVQPDDTFRLEIIDND